MKQYTLLILFLLLPINLGANTVRISLINKDANIKITQFDPAKIIYIRDWDMAMNLYSRLVAFDREGNLVSALATKFYWRGSEAHFEIRQDFKTADGQSITPEDIAYSLKRLIILDSNAHGKVNYLCGKNKPKSIISSCEGISFDSKKIILKFKKQDPFLFKTLTAGDFSIIPKRSIDPDTLRIKDYKNTTGLYYFSGYNKKKNLILKINPSHWLYAKNIPHQIEIIPDVYQEENDGELILSKMLRGKLDIISRSNRPMNRKLFFFREKLQKKNIKHDFHHSKPTRLRFLRFTPRGFALKPEIRFAILQDTRRLLKRNKKLLSSYRYERADYIFPTGGHGSLDSKANEFYKHLLSKPIDTKIPKTTIEVMVTHKVKDIFQKLLQGGYFKYKISAMPMYQEYIGRDPDDKSIPHLTYNNQDIMFDEDIGLLSYSFHHSDMFAIKGDKAKKWLSDFKNQLDDKKRMGMLKALHYKSIVTNPSIIPLYFTREIAISTNGWKLNFPLHTVDTLYWYIKKNE